MRTKTFILTLFLAGLVATSGFAQDKPWSLDDCINYALEHNIQVKKANLSTTRSLVLTNQAKSNRLPAVSANVRQNFGLSKELDTKTGEYGALNGSNSTNYSVNSSVSIFNGFKLQNTIKQNELNLASSKLYTETVKESVGLNILNAFLQVIYSGERVKNAQKQIEATTEQLALAKERLDLSAISRSDYLQIESELASEKLTLANSVSQFSMAKISLMQLMELPVTESFTVVSPDIDELLKPDETLTAASIYEQAIKIKPQIKSAELTTESAKLDTEIAKANLLPSLSIDAGLSTGYSSRNTNFNYVSQLNNGINPTLGLSLSIPIFQKNQVKSNIAVAQIGVDDAKLDELNTRNQLRKEIEQACADAISAKTEYEASTGQLRATNESYSVSTEKFKLGLLNSVDFLFEKTKLITAESQLLQAKFNLVFSKKIIDFYKGVPLTL
jgi:outer membrane protein